MTPTPQAIENAARAGEPCPGLKPCPFCGEKKIYFNLPDPETDFPGSLNCPACLASMPNETNNVEELIECWNHREPTDLGDMVLVPKEATEAVLDRAVSFALKITIDGGYRWRDYMRDLYRAMIAAAEDSNDQG